MPVRFGSQLVSLLALAWTLLVGASLATAAPPRAPTDHVTDAAGVLSPAARQSLSQRLARYDEDGGHQVIVWIADTAGGQDIEGFAAEAFEAWGVGNEKLDDGLALFVFTEERKLRVEVGYDLESAVTDLVSSRIIRETIVPRIRADDWDGAIVGGIEALVDTVEGRPDALPSAGAPPERGPPEREIGPLQILLYVGLGIGFLILFVTNPRLALMLLYMIGRVGGGGGGAGGFSGRGGRSGGGGATGGW